MRLHDVEPEVGSSNVQPLLEVIELLLARPHRRPFMLAIDGRSSNGKSTLADRIAVTFSPSAVVHTDDIAWWHSRFGWDDLLLAEIIEPLRRGGSVEYRPPAWEERGRQGSIVVPADLDLVVVEGVGAGRASLAGAVDAIIWVQADLDVTEARNLQRIAAGEIDERGYQEWMAEEVPFQAQERPWERADVIVCGTCPVADPASHVVVLRPITP